MRMNPGLLLVVLAITVPFIVELRTVAAWIGLDLSIAQTALIGVAILGAIVLWAITGDADENGSGTTG